MDVDQIDKSKENIQPLRQGRVSSQLNEALNCQASINLQIQQTIQKKIQDYETALHTYEGDDPLSPWVDYINWVEQYFPKHGKEGNFANLLKSCLDMFKDYTLYKEDPRYVNLWIKYLDMQPENSSEMYRMVLNHGIGTKVAQFYHSWAMQLANAGDLRSANQVYCMGASAGAQPAEDLEQAHKNLQCLVMKRSMETEGQEPLFPVMQESRATLGPLHASGHRNSVPSERSQPLVPLQQSNRGSLQHAPLSNTPKPSFSLFKDENQPMEIAASLPSKQPLRSFPAREVLQAENLQEPAPWTECASHQPVPPMQVTTPFKVHQDPVTVPCSATKKILPGSVLQAHKTVEQPEWTDPSTVFEPPNPKYKLMYCKEKVYAGGIEFSFEELRAHKYIKLYNARKLLESKDHQSSSVTNPSPAEPTTATQPIREPLLPNQRIMAPEECQQEEPEVSLEENLMRNHARLRKAWQERRAKRAQAEAKAENMSIPKELTYMLPPNCRLMAPPATFENGVETSIEELRARIYMERCNKAPMSEVPSGTAPPDPPVVSDSKEAPPTAVAVVPPVEVAATEATPYPELQNPKLFFMCDILQLQTQDSELSVEERRALRYMQAAASAKDVQCSNASSPSSRGTTPSSTPGRMGHLSILGQSMTVNTKEAIAAMKDLWCSRYESPQPTKSPPKPAAFSIFCDSQPTPVPASVPQFNIFSDSRATSVPARENNYVRHSKSLGPKRGLQLNDLAETHPMMDQSEPWPLYHDPPEQEKSLPLASKFPIFQQPEVLAAAQDEKIVYSAQKQPLASRFPIFQQPEVLAAAQDEKMVYSAQKQPLASRFPIFQQPEVLAAAQDEKMVYSAQKQPLASRFPIFQQPQVLAAAQEEKMVYSAQKQPLASRFPIFQQPEVLAVTEDEKMVSSEQKQPFGNSFSIFQPPKVLAATEEPSVEKQPLASRFPIFQQPGVLAVTQGEKMVYSAQKQPLVEQFQQEEKMDYSPQRQPQFSIFQQPGVIAAGLEERNRQPLASKIPVFKREPEQMDCAEEIQPLGCKFTIFQQPEVVAAGQMDLRRPPLENNFSVFQPMAEGGAESMEFQSSARKFSVFDGFNLAQSKEDQKTFVLVKQEDGEEEVRPVSRQRTCLGEQEVRCTSVWQGSSGTQEDEIQQEPLQMPPKYEIPYIPPPADDDQCEEAPNKENDSPSNYQLPAGRRGLSGVLTEAVNVPFIPLEEQERMLDEEEQSEESPVAQDEETAFHLQAPSRFMEDVTSMTSVFKQPNFSSSTPYHAPQSLLSRVLQPTEPKEENVIRAVSAPMLQEEEAAADPEQEAHAKSVYANNWDNAEITAARVQPLSPILEMTGESRSSRSGSSSGSSVSSRLHSHMFSKTPGQFSKTPGQFSNSKTPGEFSNSKTPGQFSTTGCSTAFSEARPVRMRLLQLEEEEEQIPLMPLTMAEPVDFVAEAQAQGPQLLQVAAAQVVAKTEVKIEAIEREIATLDLNPQDIDPFCSQLQRKLLSTLPTTFDARPGFSQSSTPLPTFRVHQRISIGNSVATLKRSLGEGAYAKIYLAVTEPEGKLVVLKYSPEDTTCWDFYISSEIQSRLTDPCMAKRFSHISNTYLHDNGVIYQMDFISKATLLDVINHYRQVNQEVPPNMVVYLTLQILQLVQALHQVQIIHADLKPDNFLLIPSDDQYFGALHLIDFGRCIDMSLLPTGSSFKTTFKCADFRSVEMRTNRPWTYQLDFYGIAATIHCLLFGKYMNIKEVRGRWMPTCKPKRFWEQTPLYEKLFETLLNVESCDQQPDLQPFINSLQQVVESNKSLIIKKELKTVFISKNDN